MASENATIATDARYFRVNRRELVYLKFILEAYEGLSTLSTVDREGVIVRIGYPRCFSRDMDSLLQALGNEIALAEVPPPADDALPQDAFCEKGEKHA